MKGHPLLVTADIHSSEEALEANRAIFPLMVRLAEFNGCFIGLEGNDPEFDEWEAWREQATDDE